MLIVLLNIPKLFVLIPFAMLFLTLLHYAQRKGLSYTHLNLHENLNGSSGGSLGSSGGSLGSSGGSSGSSGGSLGSSGGSLGSSGGSYVATPDYKLQSWVQIQQSPQPTVDCQSLDGQPSGMALCCRLSSEGRQRRIY
jgi:hypothetical protein